MTAELEDEDLKNFLLECGVSDDVPMPGRLFYSVARAALQNNTEFLEVLAAACELLRRHRGAASCDAEFGFLSRYGALPLDRRHLAIAALSSALGADQVYTLWCDDLVARLQTQADLPKALLLRDMHRSSVEARPPHDLSARLSNRHLDEVEEFIWRQVGCDREAHLRPEHGRKGSDGFRRILCVVSFLPPPVFHPHLKQVILYSAGLAEASPGVEITILVTLEAHLAGKILEFDVDTTDFKSIRRELLAEVAGKVRDRISIEYGAVVDGVADLVQTAGRITAIDPDAVVSWGGVYEPKLFRQFLYRNFPHVQIQFNIANVEHEFTDIIMAHGGPSSLGMIWPAAGRRFPKRWRYHKVPIELPPKETVYAPEEVKREPDEFTVATVASGGRIERAVIRFQSEIVGSLGALMQARPKVAWVCIGVQRPEAILGVHPIFAELAESDRLRFMPYEPNLRSFYAHCDAYLHLPSIHGGGGGIAMAAIEAVPILVMDGCDADNFLPPEAMHPDFGAAVAKLGEFIDDPASAAAVGQKCQTTLLSGEHARFAVGRALQKALEEARASFQARAGENGSRDDTDPENGMSDVNEPVHLHQEDEAISSRQEWLLDQIETVYGRRSGLSDAIHDEGFQFIDTVARLVSSTGRRIDFLEIGSFMGISMAAWATSLLHYGALGICVSVDPYSPEAYTQTPPWQETPIRAIVGPEIMAHAADLYSRCGLNVRQVRASARDALPGLLAEPARFDLIFVDGNHEGLNPFFDVGAAIALSRAGGYLVLDDTTWPDVLDVKRLCDRHLEKVAETHVKVCYRLS